MTTPPTKSQIVTSALWIVVLLNALFRDVHEFLAPGVLDEIATGTLNGTPLNDAMLLIAAILLEIPIAMVALSLILPGRWFGSLNAAAALVTLAGSLAFGAGDMDDAFFLTARVTALLAILWIAWMHLRRI